MTLRNGKQPNDVRASAWLVSSQNRPLVVTSKWNGETVPCRLKVAIDKLGLDGGKDGEEIVITDLETDSLLMQAKNAGTSGHPKIEAQQ